nr:hypothetical protein [Deltaproteobacteria bacterium]
MSDSRSSKNSLVDTPPGLDGEMAPPREGGGADLLLKLPGHPCELVAVGTQPLVVLGELDHALGRGLRGGEVALELIDPALQPLGLELRSGGLRRGRGA